MLTSSFVWLGAQVKQAGRAVMRFAGGGGARTSAYGGWSFGASRYGLREADVWRNSAVAACIGWMARVFPEAPLQVERLLPDGSRERIPGHPLTALWESPNPAYSGALLTMALVEDFMIHGNSYALKARSATGRTLELWWLPAADVTPEIPDDGSTYITSYRYTPGGQAPAGVSASEGVLYDAADVVHFRNGLDPRDVRSGKSALRSVPREVSVDEEAQVFSSAMLRNSGIPGAVIRVDKGNGTLQSAEADELKSVFVARFGGERRGDPMVVDARSQIEILGFSPEQMNLTQLRRLPEERISAVLGVPPVVAGLGIGYEHSIWNNVEQAREMAYESMLKPTYRLWAAEIQTQLLGDFGDPATERVSFDLSVIAALGENVDALHARVRADLAAGVITVNEARTALGYTEIPRGDTLLLASTIIPTPIQASAPEPAPPSEGDEEPTPLRAGAAPAEAAG